MMWYHTEVPPKSTWKSVQLSLTLIRQYFCTQRQREERGRTIHTAWAGPGGQKLAGPAHQPVVWRGSSPQGGCSASASLSSRSDAPQQAGRPAWPACRGGHGWGEGVQEMSWAHTVQYCTYIPQIGKFSAVETFIYSIFALKYFCCSSTLTKLKT